MNGKIITTGSCLGETFQLSRDFSLLSEAETEKKTEFGVIGLYPEIQYQMIEGFGGAMTEASAWLLSQLPSDVRKDALKKFFGADGNRLKFVRISLDSCDFALGEYQAVEDPLKDPEFKSFSLKRDRQYIIPMMKEAMALSENDLSVLLSPWSPPSVWKTPADKPRNDGAVYGGMPDEILSLFDFENPSRTAGSLRHEYYKDWAVYMVKYILAYLDEGIPVTMLTIQNESSAATFWDSCVWTAEEQRIFLKEFLYPEMERAGLTEKVGIYIWDHNKERAIEFCGQVLDNETLSMVQGIAFHWYSGDHFDAVGILKDRYPGKVLMSSECCGMLPMPMGNDFEMSTVIKTDASFYFETAVAYAHDLIGNLNQGMNRWIDWNLCLDEAGGPRHVPGGCTASMTVHPDGTYSTNVIYEYIGHFSRYILPGAKRIAASICDKGAEVTAAENPDGSIVLVLLNSGNEDRSYTLRIKGEFAVVELPAKTISTVMLVQ